jgi:Fibronectin type III-like domain
MQAAITAFKAHNVIPFALGDSDNWPSLMWLEYLTDRIGGPSVFNAIDNGNTSGWSSQAITTALADIQSLIKQGACRLPLSMPRSPGGQPWTYLQPRLGLANPNSSVDPTPLYPFGHGLGYTSFAWQDFAVGQDELRVEDGEFEVEVTVRNVGDRAGGEVVQLYLHDPVAQVTRPWARLIGFAKVRLEPGGAERIRFVGHVDLTAFTGRSGRRVVEPGDIELRLASSSADEAVRHRAALRLVGRVRELPPPLVGRAPSRLVCRVETVG